MRCTWNNNMRWRKETLLERPPPPTVNFTRSSNIYALEVPSKSKLGSLLQVWLVYVTWALLEGSHIVNALRSLCENVECTSVVSPCPSLRKSCLDVTVRLLLWHTPSDAKTIRSTSQVRKSPATRKCVGLLQGPRIDCEKVTTICDNFSRCAPTDLTMGN